VFSVCRKCVTEKRSLDPTVRKENIFARPLHNEQFYSLILECKVALFLPFFYDTYTYKTAKIPQNGYDFCVRKTSVMLTVKNN
jgi:hypothetical protein